MLNKILTIISLILLYYLLKYYIPYGDFIVYPITLLVVFLHEFGHGLGAIITGGGVESIQLNTNGSGYAITTGGWRSVVLMGGYIGSAILGNLLLYIGAKKEKYAESVIYILAGLMLFTAFIWYESIVSTILLLFVAGLFILFARNSKFDSIFLQFLGVASLVYIIEDFNVGPSSDLAKFADIFIIFPQSIWMYIWLLLVLFITFINLKIILRK